MDSMVVAGQLDEFPGAPFSDDLVEIAEASIRAEAGWHIAPVVSETFRFASWRSPLFIPSQRIVSVDAVRVGGTTVSTGWELADGVLSQSGWYGLGAVEVDVTHGFESVPLDLLPVIAARARDLRSNVGNVETQSMGPYRVTYRATSAPDPAFSRYFVHPVVVA